MLSEGFAGAIFDVDGVLVDTPHEQAWKESLRELMDGEWADIRDQTEWSPEHFTARVYQQVLSGKPRKDGALAGLEYFNVPNAEHRAATYAAHKQKVLISLIEAQKFHAYPDALRFVLAVRAAGIPMAVASSSKNADPLLRRIQLDTFAQQQGLDYDFLSSCQNLFELFDADLSGRDLARGKPDPEIFLNAANELAVAPADSVVVEDAVSGVQAAKAGGMAALGVARADDENLLIGAHADLVVTSLDEVDVTNLSSHQLTRRLS